MKNLLVPALAIPTDVTIPEQITQGVQAVRDAFGSVDILINHGGNATHSLLMGDL